MRVISLASGSKGNAYLVGDEGRWLLVDNGVHFRMFATRLKSVDVELADIVGVLITHSHSDHVAGLRKMLNHQPMPVFANTMTAETVCEGYELREDECCCFENGQEFEVDGFRVLPFSIPHDTSDPVGYLVTAGDETYFHGTDIGTPLDTIGLKLREAQVATLESNHDLVMLKTSNRPPSLIQRIASPRGHLSNDQSGELVRKFASPKLKRLGLAHLSRDCNAPHIAEREMRATLAAMKREDVTLKVFAQDEVVEL